MSGHRQPQSPTSPTFHVHQPSTSSASSSFSSSPALHHTTTTNRRDSAVFRGLPSPTTASGLPPSRRWLLSKTPSQTSSHRPGTASTVQSFTSASPDLVSDNEDADLYPDGRKSSSSNSSRRRSSQSGTPTPSSPARRTAHLAGSTSRRLSGAATNGKIGKSFETLLKSNETWVLKETAEVAESQSSSTDSAPGHQGGASANSSSPTPSDPNRTVQVIARQPRYKQQDDEPLPSSADVLASTQDSAELSPFATPKTLSSSSPPSSPPQSSRPLRGERKRGNAGSSVPAYPHQGSTGTVYTVRKTTEDFRPPSKQELQRPDSAKTITSMPFPRDDVVRPPPKENSRTVAAVMPEAQAPDNMTSLADELGINPDTNATAAQSGMFRERMKKTSGFLKRFRGNSLSDKRLTGKQAGAGASTASLAQPSSRRGSMASEHGASGGGGGSSSHPPSPSMGGSRSFARDQQPPVPVPAIPQKYASTAASTAAAQPPAEIPPRRANASAAPHTAPRASDYGTQRGASNTPPGLGEPIDLEKRGNTPRAASASPVASVSKAPVVQQRTSSGMQARHRAGQDSKSSMHTTGSGELRSTLRAWESEMDNALKESAQDLETKTKFTDKATWGPSPKLPELGLGIGLDEAPTGDHRGPSARPQAGTPRSNTLNVDESLRRKGGASSAPATPMGATHPNDGQRRSASALGTAPTSASVTPSGRPWERSRSPYLNPATSDSSRPAPRSADGHSNQTHRGRASPRGSSGPELTPKPGAEHIDTAYVPGKASIDSTIAHTGASSGSASVKSTVSRAGRPGASAEMRTPSLGHTASKGRDSASGASVVSFETAAEGEGNGQADGRRDQALRGRREEAGSRGGVHDDDELSDESEDELRPEQSIRLIMDSAKASASAGPDGDGPLPRSVAMPGAATGTSAAGLGVVEEGPMAARQRHAPRDVSTVGPLPSERANRPPSRPQRQRSQTSVRSSNAVIRPASSPPVHYKARARSIGGGASAAECDTESVLDEPNEARAKELADKCWQEDETFMKKEKIAEWLGGLGSLIRAARDYYFANFDFQGMRVDVALRHLCDKLFLRAETQQVDRILASFSRRFWQCNPLPVYSSADHIHALVFSVLLLNTDLYVADISDRMTRQQFVRNTMSALTDLTQTDSTVPVAAASASSLRVGAMSPGPQHRDSDSVSLHSSRADHYRSDHGIGHDGAGVPRPASVRGNRRDSVGSLPASGVGTPTGTFPRAGSKANYSTSAQALQAQRHETELENLLKDMYAAVRADRIRLPMSDVAPPEGIAAHRRTARTQLGPPSASLNGSNRISQLKRGSIRGMAGLLGASYALRSEESVSPGSQSSIGSRSVGDSWLASTTPGTSGTSMTSVGALSSQTPATLGFASTLTQTMIKEAQDEDHPSSVNSGIDDLDDDELALIGAPWAKEGFLNRKHYWEAPQKRAKDKSWTEVFVVVQKGVLSMFKFGESSGSTKANASPLAGASGFVVGGGNWLSNATNLGEIHLAHTLSNALPPPGYNRSRPHVFALTLTSGAVHFFQAGTEDLVQEWVSTCNYWAARTSRPPLAGGVSNMEYGWNRVLPQVDDYDDTIGEGDEGLEEDEPEYLADDAASSHEGTATTTVHTATAAAGSGSGSGSPQGWSTGKGGSNQASSDNRSIRSGRSGRSLGSKMGGHFYQSWQDAATNMMGSNSSSGQSSGGGGRGNRAESFSSAFPGVSGSNSGSGGLSVASAFRSRSGAPSVRSLSFYPGGSSSHGHGAGGTSEQRVYVNEWKAPVAPTLPSTLKEEEQLEACVAYIARVESDLTTHNELRQPMLALYQSGGSGRGTVGGAGGGSNSANGAKALANWERKSNHLLAELVRWQGYVEGLNNAMRLKGEKRDERAMETALARADEEMAKVKEGEEGGPIPVSP